MSVTGSLAADLGTSDPGAIGMGFYGPDERTYGIASVLSYDSGTDKTSFALSRSYLGTTVGSAVVTLTIASPTVISWTAHALAAGAGVKFATTGALPTGLTAGTTYYVSTASLATDTFRIADTQAHALAGTNSINTSGSQSGVHTASTVPASDRFDILPFQGLSAAAAYQLSKLFAALSSPILSVLVSRSATIELADAAAAAVGAELVIDQAITLTAHTTLAAKCVRFAGGKVILGAYNLTISGALAASPAQIFDASGAGAAALGLNPTIWADWWGLTPNVMGTTNNAPSFQAALTAGMLKGCEVTASSGAYRTTAQLVITQCVTFRGRSKPGNRVYANATLQYGGLELVYDASPSDPLDPGSFAIKIDTGTVGSEGYSNTGIIDIGISYTGNAAGGIYGEALDNVDITGNWLTGGKVNYDAGAQTGIAMYFNDMICSKVISNRVLYSKYCVVAEEQVSRNTFAENDFVGLSVDGGGSTLPTYMEIGILFRGIGGTSTTNTVCQNEFIRNHHALVVAGDTRNVTFRENHCETSSHGDVIVTNTDPIDSSVNGEPSNVAAVRNEFIATGADGIVTACISYDHCVGGEVSGNSLTSPTGNCNALLFVASTASEIVVFGNNNLDSVPECLGFFDGIKKLDSRGLVQSAATGGTLNVFGVGTLGITAGSDYNLTSLTNGYPGQVVTLLQQSPHTTTVKHDGTHFALGGSADYPIAINNTISLQCFDGVTWFPVGARIP